MSLTTFMEVDIRHRMAKAANVIINDLDLNFQGQAFQFAILTRIGRKNANITIANR